MPCLVSYKTCYDSPKHNFFIKIMIDSGYSYNAYNSISDTHFDTVTTEWSNPDSEL